MLRRGVNVIKTETVCDLPEQVKLAASALLLRTRGLNCVETAHNINSEDHKGVSEKKKLLAFNRNSAQPSGANEIHG